MENIFSLIIRSYRLSDEEAMALFACDKDSLDKIVSGQEKPGAQGMYNVNVKYDVSLKYMMEGKPSGESDKRICQQLETMIKCNKIKDRADQFHKKLVRAGLGSVVDLSQVSGIYDATDDLITLGGVFRRDNFKLYSFAKSFPLSTREFRLPGENHDTAAVKDWKEADRTAAELYLRGALKDPEFASLVNDAMLKSFDEGMLVSFLYRFRNGNIPFNPAVVLKLIKHGAFLKVCVKADEGGGEFENDVLGTLVLKDYCERLLSK